MALINHLSRNFEELLILFSAVETSTNFQNGRLFPIYLQMQTTSNEKEATEEKYLIFQSILSIFETQSLKLR